MVSVPAHGERASWLIHWREFLAHHQPVPKELVSPFLDHEARPFGAVVDLVVLHATAVAEEAENSVDNSLAILRSRELSYHFIVAKSGLVYVCVPPEHKAFHAGSSYGPLEASRGESRDQDANSMFAQGIGVNPTSIGISLSNLNDGKDDYPAAQTDAVAELVMKLMTDFPTLTFVTSHAAIAPGRKTDPAGFDVAAFAKRVGLTPWLG